MNHDKTSKFVPVIIILLVIIPTIWLLNKGYEPNFDPNRAYENIQIQLSFGPRFPTSSSHQKEIEWIKNILVSNKWDVEDQSFKYKDTQITNILATKGDGKPTLLLSTHYDTREFSDQESDSSLRLLPVPGANDGASGVAVILELARILPDKNIQLVFFDAEDQGEISGWDWCIGSTYFATNLKYIPEKVIILDMIADKDLQIYQEAFSDRSISSEIWGIGQELGYPNIFINEVKYALIDDHKPFIDSGIPAVLIIDFDYPFWHTSHDGTESISIDSLKIIGSVILEWIKTTS